MREMESSARQSRIASTKSLNVIYIKQLGNVQHKAAENPFVSSLSEITYTVRVAFKRGLRDTK